MGYFSPRFGGHVANVTQDVFAGPPERTVGRTWIGGVVVPLAMAVYGLSCCVTASASFPARHGIEPLLGAAAVAYGIAWLSAGAFLHFHFFWGTVDRLCGLSEPGKIASLAVLAPSALYVLFKCVTAGYG